MSNSSIWAKDRTLSGATTPGQSGPGSDRNEEVFSIHLSFRITGASLSDCLVSYPGHLLWGILPSTEMQLVYSTAPAGWADNIGFDLDSINNPRILKCILSKLGK